MSSLVPQPSWKRKCGAARRAGWRPVFLLILISLLQSVAVSGRQVEDDVVTAQERVRVVNVEIPVYVFDGGEAVTGLKKSDFKLYESGKEQTIHGFYEKRKQITPEKEPGSTEPQPSPDSRRYFVLVFRIISYNEQMQRGLEYLFEEVFHPGDRLLVFANNRSMLMRKLPDRQQALSEISAMLRGEAVRARQRLLTSVDRIEDEIKRFRLTLGSMNPSAAQPGQEMIKFLNRYLLVWRDYKNQFLVPDMDTFYYFARHLENVTLEKWVINFFQIEMFPKLKLSGQMMEDLRREVGSLQASSRPEDNVYAKTITSLLMEIDKELNAPLDFPAAEVSKLFYKTDASFHSVLIPLNKELLSNDLVYQRIASDLENSLREITRRTGGNLVFGGDIARAVTEIEDSPISYYMLTYAPEHPERVGKVRVSLVNKPYRVLYDDQIRADYLREYLQKKKLAEPDIQIDRFEMKNKTLLLSISGYERRRSGNQSLGNLRIHLVVKQVDGKTLYDQSRDMIAGEERVNASIDLPWLGVHRVDIIVHVTDHYSGKTTMDFLTTGSAEYQTGPH